MIIQVFVGPAGRCSVHVRDREVIYELHLESQFSKSFHGIFVPELFCLLLGDQDKLMFEQPSSFLDTVLGRRLLVNLFEVHYQALLDAKNRVGRFIRISTKVEGSVLCQLRSAVGFIPVWELFIIESHKQASSHASREVR